MDRFDFSPLFRSTIGFDRLVRLVDRDDAVPSYPPYNIEKTGEDSYRVTLAVAGFSPEEIDVTVHENSLLVTGKAKKRRTSVICIAAVPAVPSSGASASPITSRLSAPSSSTACCTSTSPARCPRR